MPSWTENMGMGWQSPDKWPERTYFSPAFSLLNNLAKIRLPIYCDSSCISGPVLLPLPQVIISLLFQDALLPVWMTLARCMSCVFWRGDSYDGMSSAVKCNRMSSGRPKKTKQLNKKTPWIRHNSHVALTGHMVRMQAHLMIAWCDWLNYDYLCFICRLSWTVHKCVTDLSKLYSQQLASLT